MLRVEKDFEEFIGLLNKHEVQYMIVGAYALALYAQPRNTGDIDIFISHEESNAEKMIAILEEFGFQNIGIAKTDFMTLGRIIQLGVSPVRIDIINDIDGIEFSKAYNNLVKFKFGSVMANFISKEDLIKNKQSSNRTKDRADLDELLRFEDDN